MNITVIGWYGTETIGDRAVLAGIFSFFSKAFDHFQVKLGSLYPFFTQRTLLEDAELWHRFSDKEIAVEVFNSQKPVEIDRAIEEADLLIMGGGPLMHVPSLFMVEYAFKKAKRLKKKTAVIGCGIGPLFGNKYQKAVIEIVKCSDLLILRDKTSERTLIELSGYFKCTVDRGKIFISYDPAVACAIGYRHSSQVPIKDYITINLRMFTREYSKRELIINDNFRKFVIDIANKYPGRQIRLIPMHYFHIGNDDRFFLNAIVQGTELENLSVQNTPLTLTDTMEVFREAYFNVGMRFHSIILQTIISGRNYVLDYTDPRKGKIISFLNDIDKNAFYRERYINLQEERLDTSIIKNDDIRFHIDKAMLDKRLEIYVDKLKELVQ